MSSVSDAVESAGVQARTSSVKRSSNARVGRARSRLAALGPASSHEPHWRSSGQQPRFGRFELIVGQHPGLVELSDSLQINHAVTLCGCRYGWSDPAGRCEVVLQLSIVLGLRHPVARECKGHPGLARSIEEERLWTSEPVMREALPSTCRSLSARTPSFGSPASSLDSAIESDSSAEGRGRRGWAPSVSSSARFASTFEELTTEAFEDDQAGRLGTIPRRRTRRP